MNALATRLDNWADALDIQEEHNYIKGEDGIRLTSEATSALIRDLREARDVIGAARNARAHPAQQASAIRP